MADIIRDFTDYDGGPEIPPVAYVQLAGLVARVEQAIQAAQQKINQLVEQQRAIANYQERLISTREKLIVLTWAARDSEAILDMVNGSQGV